MKIIIKYIGIALVIAGILLVMKNLVTKDTSLLNNDDKKNEEYYSVEVKLLNKDTKKYVEGAKLVLKDKDERIVKEWITTKEVYTISKLEKGKYTLTQVSAPKNYKLNEESITFELKDKNRNLVMYNTKMTNEEIKESNTSKDNVEVDNTLSSKSVITIIISLISTIIGFGLIYKVKKTY